MSAKTDEILDSLKSLSLLEASELVKQIEEAFGVSAAASAGVVMAAPGGAAAGAAGCAVPGPDASAGQPREQPRFGRAAPCLRGISAAVRAVAPGRAPGGLAEAAAGRLSRHRLRRDG